MARLPYPDINKASAQVRELYDTAPVKLNIMKMLTYLDESFAPLLQFAGKLLTAQKLSPLLRELAILRVARLSDAEYEWVQHVPFAEDAGASAAQIKALDRGQNRGDCFNELEALVLAFTDEVVDDVRPSDDTLERLRAKLSDQEVVELTLAIGFYMTMARIMEVTGVEVEAPAGLQVVTAMACGGA